MTKGRVHPISFIWIVQGESRRSSTVAANGHTDRKSSFIPIKEDEVDIDERRKYDDDDDEPGRKLSYFVENDVYVTYDSNA